MLSLSIASLAFLLTHFGISSTPLRPWLMARLGENGYLAGYSILALACLGVMIDSYGSLAHNEFIWPPSPVLSWLVTLVMPLALVLLMSGLVIQNPTAVKMTDVVHRQGGDALPGMLKITRHPVQWGILLWAVSHLLANGDLASIVFFGTFTVLSGLGGYAMDRRRARLDDPAWRQFYAATSNVPFVALLQGRSRLRLAELNWAGIIAGLTLYALLYYFHGLIAGVPLM